MGKSSCQPREAQARERQGLVRAALIDEREAQAGAGEDAPTAGDPTVDAEALEVIGTHAVQGYFATCIQPKSGRGLHVDAQDTEKGERVGTADQAGAVARVELVQGVDAGLHGGLVAAPSAPMARHHTRCKPLQDRDLSITKMQDTLAQSRM